MFRKLSAAQLAWDIVGAGVLLFLTLPFSALTLWGPTTLGQPSVLGWVGGVVSSVILCVGVAFRRLSPPLALAIVWLGAALQLAFVLIPSLVDVGVLFVLFATSAYGSRRTMWWGLASVGAGSVIATTYLGFVFAAGFVGPGGPQAEAEAATQTLGIVFVVIMIFVACVASMGLAWAGGLLMRQRIRSREVEQQRAVAEALAVVEQQRTQIARDMHDVVAHSLAVVIAQADGARYAAAADPAIATDALHTISTTARGALSDVRLLLTQLRHSQAEGPQPTLADLEGLYAQVRAAGVELRVDVDPVPRADPPGAIQLAVYRILQEALTNALRHGDGTAVDVTLAWLTDRVDLTVRNGAGAEQPPSGGHGLLGMRERAQLVGGRLDAGAVEGVFVVSASIPIPPEESA